MLSVLGINAAVVLQVFGVAESVFLVNDRAEGSIEALAWVAQVIKKKGSAAALTEIKNVTDDLLLDAGCRFKDRTDYLSARRRD